VPTLLVAHNRGNHGGIAPTKTRESAKVKWTLYSSVGLDR